LVPSAYEELAIEMQKTVQKAKKAVAVKFSGHSLEAQNRLKNRRAGSYLKAVFLRYFFVPWKNPKDNCSHPKGPLFMKKKKL
jgi:hypothetical protein